MISPRALPVLLDQIGVTGEEVSLSHKIVDAVQAGLISNEEARHLQAFERRPLKARRRMIADAVDVSPEAIAKTRAKLADLAEQLRARNPGGGGGVR